VAEDDPRARATGDFGELDELAFAQAQHLAPDNPRVAGPIDQPKDDNDVPHAWPDDSGEEDGEDQRRQGEPGVGDAHDHLVYPAAEIAGENSQRGTDAAGTDRPDNSDNQRHPSAEDQSAQDVSGLEVGAEDRMRAAARHPEWRLENLRPWDRLSRIIGRMKLAKIATRMNGTRIASGTSGNSLT